MVDQLKKILLLSKILGGLMGLFIFLMTIGVLGFDVNDLSADPYYTSGGFVNGWPELLFYPIGVLIGLYTGLRFERAGGIIILFSLIAFHFTLYNDHGFLVLTPIIDMVAVPGIIYLVYGFSRKDTYEE